METNKKEDIDFIYQDSELGITIYVKTKETKNEIIAYWRAMYKIESIKYCCGWMRGMANPNRVAAIINTLNNVLHNTLEKDIVYYRDLIEVMMAAVEHAKELRYEQLDLFDDGSTPKTYRVSKQVRQQKRRQNKSRLSCVD